MGISSFVNGLVVKYIFGRMNEASTYSGLVKLIAAWFAGNGMVLTDPQQSSILTVILLVMGAIHTFLPDKFKK